MQVAGQGGQTLDLYMDEYVRFDRPTHPQLSVYSCQFNAYRAGDIEANKDKILAARKSVSNLESLTALMGEGFVYHVDAINNHPMNSLSKITLKKLIGFSDIVERHGYEIGNIYSCNKIGGAVQRQYHMRRTVPKAGVIYDKIRTVCSSRRNDEKLGVHYHVKEIAGFMAQRKSADVMTALTRAAEDTIALSGSMDKAQKKKMFIEMANDENAMRRYEKFYVNIPLLYMTT